MAKKPFEIQGVDLKLGGVSLQAGNNGVVIPGVTQAVNYEVHEVEDTDDVEGSSLNEESVMVLDNAQYRFYSGTSTPSLQYVAAQYTVELDDGLPDDIEVDVAGVYSAADRALAVGGDMWFTDVLNATDNFNPNDWTQFPFRPRFKATEVENVGGGGGGSISVGTGTSPSIENVTEILINGTVTEIEPGLVGISISGGEGLPTVTIPAESGSTYKGLQVAYGVVHSNGNTSEFNVNKIVIHKPAVATVAIDPTSSQDYFQVSGIDSSDVLAMFVVYGDANGAKPLSTLRAFAEAAIDHVILINGEEGVYNTVDQMKAAFNGNYQILAANSGGLYANFEFFNVNTNLTVNASSLVEGVGAIFDVFIDQQGIVAQVQVTGGGGNYQNGHRIKIPYTSVGGSSTDQDIILLVTGTDAGAILSVQIDSTIGPGVPGIYPEVSGTNYQVGTGFTVYNLNYDLNTDTVLLSNWNNGSGYVAGDVITILGTDILDATNTALVSPDNDVTITLTQVDGIGQIQNWSITGTVPRPANIWPDNNISDGGEDQYDTGNYISTNFATEIAYNGGETVVEGTGFGIGSTYSFAYETAIFAVFATNANVDYIRTNGNSGADGNSITEAGHIYGPDTAAETFDNAVTHINFVGDPWAGPIVSFTKTDYGDEIDIIVPDDGSQGGVGITRGEDNGIYNPYREEGWDDGISPSGTLWNTDGWTDLTDVETRTYAPLYEAFGSGGLGNKIVGTECVMLVIDTGKYYAVKFEQWTQGQNNGGPGGGGFSYTRREIDLNSLQQGIRFSDGTRLNSAEGIGRVKLESPGSRRIEEVYGYKQITLTQRVTSEPSTSTSVGSNEGNTWQFYISETQELLGYLNGSTSYGVEVSLDQTTWLGAYIGGSGGGNLQIVLNEGLTLLVPADTTVHYRISTGGDPVVWWDAADLPGGSTNFRGAIIKYHAYDRNAGTMVGTIYTADDDGDENVSHTEVFSGGGDGDTIILWNQTQEGQLRARRTSGEGTTIKIQWSATVFYGSEYWD